MESPHPLILIETETAADLAAILADRPYRCLGPNDSLPETEASVLLIDLAGQTPEQAAERIRQHRQRLPHLPVVLVLNEGASPPEALLERPLELIWRPLRPVEFHQRLALLVNRTPRSTAAEGFRQVFEKHHAMMLLINPASGEVVDANPAASRFYGYRRDQLRRMRIQQINQLEESEVERNIYQAHHQLTNTFNFVHRLASGELRTVEVHSTPVEIEGQQLLFSILHDITRRQQAEEALRRSEEQYRQLFELVPLGISVTDADGRLLAYNQAMVETGGGTRADYGPHANAGMFYTRPADRAEVLAEFQREGSIQRREIVLCRLDGSPYHALLTMAPIGFAGQAGMLVLVEDVTERKQQDEHIRHALHEREILLREIHHRVKNNFQVIISLLNMQSRKLQNQAAAEALIEMRNRIRSMALIHERIYHSHSLADVDFGEYLQFLTRELFSPDTENPVQLVFRLASLKLDIEQAIPSGLLVNELLTNAFKYAFPADWQGPRKIEIQLSQVAEQIHLLVADTGVGMAPELDPNQSRTLGLQLICQLVRQLGGSWELVRQLGGSWELERQGGTRWQIRFPLLRSLRVA